MTTTSTTEIKYTAEAGIDIEKIKTSAQFTNWLTSVDRQRFNIRGVHFQSVDMFGPKIGFIKFKADIVDASGKFVPGILFMRGGSVAMLVVLKCNGKKYVPLTVQPRVATGRFDFEEIPAGMLDGSGNFAGVAAKELQEELKLTINEADLVDLTELAGYKGGYYPSAGGSDETIRIFYYEKDVTAEELAEMSGRLTGCLSESEQITLKIIELDDLWKLPDSKSGMASLLYTKLKDKLSA
ncbi:MAG: NUDIX domain-containing protein [Candidatus Obscuribacterales bacterium]|nr:NUDIX domain-containing protein [Candidatus Obscuribacterales bacterium]